MPHFLSRGIDTAEYPNAEDLERSGILDAGPSRHFAPSRESGVYGQTLLCRLRLRS